MKNETECANQWQLLGLKIYLFQSIQNCIVALYCENSSDDETELPSSSKDSESSSEDPDTATTAAACTAFKRFREAVKWRKCNSSGTCLNKTGTTEEPFHFSWLKLKTPHTCGTGLFRFDRLCTWGNERVLLVFAYDYSYRNICRSSLSFHPVQSINFSHFFISFWMYIRHPRRWTLLKCVYIHHPWSSG